MAKTLGYHLVKSTYGQWLPGDQRDSWSEAWDNEIGYVKPHTLHPGDPARQRMAKERMLHEPVWLTDVMIAVIAETVSECVNRSAGELSIAAAAIESTHMHLLILYSGREIENTAKWLADRTTKAIHRDTNHCGPVWCKSKWCSYVFENTHWGNISAYIERHNTRSGRAARPYAFLV